MKLPQVQVAALVASIASAQYLNIPTPAGEVVALSEPSIITGSEDFGNKEFDRGQLCDSDEDTGSDNAVFVLEDGASISNVIIGADSLEGVHCKGSCTLTNVWFRDVCEDAISVLGTGDVTIVGGGAQEAKDKVVQHNGVGTVTIKDFTIINAGKLYRSCGDCTDNEAKSPRNVIVENVRAYGMTSDLIGINSNFGDTASITGSCGTTEAVCREYKGVNKGDGDSEKLDTNDSCGGDQGKLETLPECGAGDALPETETPTETTTPASSGSAVPIANEPEETANPSATDAEEAPEETEAPADEEDEVPVPTAVPEVTAAPTTLVTQNKTTEPAATGDSSSGRIARWGQCGGSGYSGATSCVDGATCTEMNPYYSQCL